MSTTTNTFTGGGKAASRPLDPATRRWLPVLRLTTAVIALGMLSINLVAGTFIPVVTIVALPFIIAYAATYRWPRGGSIAGGVLALLLILAFIPEIRHDMRYPASAFTFVLTGILVVAAVAGIIAGALLLAKRDWAAAPRVLQGAAGVAIVAVLVVAIGARLTLESHAAEPGDLSVVAKDLEFLPGELRAPAGTVAVHVKNSERAHHDFTIVDLGVKLQVPERSSRRIAFDAEPGTYTVVCTVPGHSDMRAMLVVE